MTVTLPPFELRPLALDRYRRLGAQTHDDAKGGWLLAGLVDAKASMYDEAEQVAHDDDQDRPGWVAATDPLTCHRSFLPWAAQLYGTSVPVENIAPGVPDATVDRERQRVNARGLYRRGSTQAIVMALAAATTGQRLPIVRERYDPTHPSDDKAWHTTLRYRTADVTNPTLLYALAVDPTIKPAGLTIHILIEDRRDYDQSSVDFPTYQDRTTGNASYDDTGTP
jgi:hypothetical protein